MNDFWADFKAPSNFPINLWIAVTGIAGIVTGLALGAPFGALLFHPGMAAWLGVVTLVLLLWSMSLMPLYFMDLPMDSAYRRAGVAAVLAGALVLTYQYGGELAAGIDAPEWQPLGYAVCFWGPCLLLGLPLMYEQLDEFEQRKDTGPGVVTVLHGRVLQGKRQGAKAGLWSAIRRRVVASKGE